MSDIDSAFPLQEYIAHLVQLDPHDVDAIVNVPGGPKENSGLGLGVDEKDGGSVDESCWIYEQLRLVVGMFGAHNETDDHRND